MIDLGMPGDNDQAKGDEEDNPSSPDAKGHPAFPISLKLPRGLRWTSAADQDVAMDTQSESESEDSDDDQPTKKKKKKRHEIEHDLTASLHNRTPQSSADFERLLLSSPNSSFLWIQFMSFQLQLSEIEKAREIGRRAIQTINFREEQERLNVWIALLNLENSYGTEQTLDTVFKEAARANDPKTIHLRLASILEDTQKVEVDLSSLGDQIASKQSLGNRGSVSKDLQEV
jgi:rRNA biogenesis protein RRP5